MIDTILNSTHTWTLSAWLLVINTVFALLSAPIHLLFFAILYKPLKRTFDPILFTEKYWTPTELVAYSGYPLVIGRIGGYAISVVAKKGSIFRRRFKNFDLRPRVSRKIYCICVLFTAWCLGTFLSVAMCAIMLLFGVHKH